MRAVLLRLSWVTFLSLIMAACTPCFCDRHLFSEVNGMVLYNGAPLADVEVVQFFHSYAHNTNGRNSMLTDEHGKFHFAKITRFVSIETRHKPTVEQLIKIRYQDREYVGWGYSKYNYDDKGELGKALDLKCDLAAIRTNETLPNGNSVTGMCTFN